MTSYLRELRAITLALPALAVALSAGCASHTSATSSLPPSAVSSTGRSGPADMVLDDGWRFIRSDVPRAKEADFDDASWQTLTLPHSWNSLDGQDGGDNYYRGAGWYRRHIRVAGGRSYFLRFDGASIDAQVFVNGTPVGRHHNAFGAFCFDVTGALKPGDNVIAVRVDNTRFDDIPPLSGDFTVFGGIYRPVHLLALNDLCVSPVDDASPGVYLRQSNVTAESADVCVTTKLLNRGASAKAATVVCTVTDAAGATVAKATCNAQLAPNTGGDAVQSVHLDHPHLWAGRRDPYLYRATVEVLDGGRVVDRIVQPLGLRTFSVDPDKGAILNGRPYDLHGVNRHQDRLDKGWAISAADMAEDFELIREMGCTAIRLAHYEHAGAFYDLCDRGGVAVWAESCLVNQLHRTPAFYENALQQLRELIKQNYNHPSILMWSLFNELEFGKPSDPANWELVGKLNDLAHRLDDTRITTGASNQAPDHPANFIPDVVAFNGYWGWYFDKITDWPAKLDRYRAAAPGRSIGVSEYGVGCSVYMHEYPPTKPNPVGWWRSEEFQCEFHETVWPVMKERPWLWCRLIWSMFDFAVDSRHEGDHLGRNDKGMVTYDRRTKKDAFYFYKANWSDEPVVYVTSRRYAVRPPGPTVMKIYSNLDEVELVVNGRSLGTKQGDEIRRFTWDVTLDPGTTHVRAIGTTKDGKRVADDVSWTVTAGAPNRYTTPGMIATTEADTIRKPAK